MGSSARPRVTDSSMRIRVAGPDDLMSVLRIHALQAGRSPGKVSDDERATWRRMMGTRDLTVYLAQLADEVVGTATVLVMPNVTYRCAPTAFVEAVVVLQKWRRLGVATTLLRQVLADLEGAGCDKVQLLSHKRHASDGAHDLYTKLGFRAEAEGFRLYLHGADSGS
jgi:GNAT superfamily N-acetyltransferase